MLWDEKYTAAKDRRKRVRTVFEIIIIIALAFLVVKAFYTLSVYQPYDEAKVETGGEDTGFIALSYYGVHRTDEEAALFGADRLRSQLKALYDRGFVTITQADIEAYYKEGKPLPKKALFLMFEDGRRETAIFTQKILEDYNFKASILTYCDKVDGRNRNYLSASELKELELSTYWELGTNGNGLHFINTVNRDNEYVVETDTLSSTLEGQYNHYLMDFMRDKDGVPLETTRHLRRRIDAEYEAVRDTYTAGTGYVPRLYTFSRAHTGRRLYNVTAGAQNAKWIYELFTMNFDHEGAALNRRDRNLYDLTRLCPVPDWSVNHLLMRIQAETGEYMGLETGNDEKLQDWELVQGAAEFGKAELILTSTPYGKGRARLKTDTWKDVHVETWLKGSSYGGQTVYLRADESMAHYVGVRLIDGDIMVLENTGHGEKELFRVEVLPRDAGRIDSALLKAPLNKKLSIDVLDNTISVTLDGDTVVYCLPLELQDSGSIFLESGWTSQAVWIRSRPLDSVYDGRFIKLLVTKVHEPEQVWYTMEFTGEAKKIEQVREIWGMILDFFLKYL